MYIMVDKSIKHKLNNRNNFKKVLSDVFLDLQILHLPVNPIEVRITQIRKQNFVQISTRFSIRMTKNLRIRFKYVLLTSKYGHRRAWRQKKITILHVRQMNIFF